MAYALGLPDALRARGLKVEVVPGWETRSAGSFQPKGGVAHWTAGPRGSTSRPSLNICINGRPGLSGPLCNVYGARDGTAVVVAAGRANHAGAGGWRGLVGNSAVFGTEMEGADASDFTQAQRWAYPRIHAAYCDLGGFGPEMNCGHSEWATPAGRKQDINGYTPDVLRRDIAAVLAGGSTTTPTQEDDMFEPYHAALLEEALRRLQGISFPTPDGSFVPRDSYRLIGVADAMQALLTRGQVNAADVAAALAPVIAAAVQEAGSDADADTIATKVLDGLAARVAG